MAYVCGAAGPGHFAGAAAPFVSRTAAFSPALSARVRRFFGFNQQELARYLGVSAVFVNHLEAGRRALSPAALAALGPLAAHVPPDNPAAPVSAPTPADFGTPDRAPLEARLDYCRHHARRLRRTLRPFEEQAAVAGRWRAALPTLLTALPPADPADPADPAAAEPPPPDPAAPDGWPAYLAWYRRRWLGTRPTALPPAASARYHLLRLQAEALETEAAALTALLG